MNAQFKQPSEARTVTSSRPRKASAGFALLAAEANLLSCRCHFCRSQLRFPLFREGEILLCPHCGMETVLDDVYSARAVSTEKYRMQIRGLRWLPGQFGIRYLIGEVAGQSTKELDWVKIEFKLYNHLDVQVGSASDHLRGFGTGPTWNFQAPVFSKDASHALLADVTCEYGSIYNPMADACLPGVTWGPAEEKSSPDFLLQQLAQRVLPRFA
jgi:hypothetical protein